ncbi:hypothetical protein A0H81_00737 [Grifola frondosa]|uniref:Protein kinase domain-containing protein n=1 Tax=Grifola frondosa TaxID=5627 RepID=A0A1C7MQK3_GRIFR|nr:hypothetical protein A0H81_00737 [Grifola frondosa]
MSESMQPSYLSATCGVSMMRRHTSYGPSATVAATNILRPRTVRESLLEAEHSIFPRVLTATYIPPPPTPQRPRVVHATPQQLRDDVDWDIKPQPEKDDNAGKPPEKGEPIPSTLLRATVYEPFGNFAWAVGLPMEDIVEGEELGCGAMCRATLNTGKLGKRKITYVCRTWPHRTQHKWRGFYAELALYKCHTFLRDLQGDVIPYIINVYNDVVGIHIAMQPPHEVFWIEASPDIPDVLKERVIEAYEKIHARGIVHGDAELRHMLIGADARVTILDFQESISTVPVASVGLRKAMPEDFAKEMRRVKYKLDYQGARAREWAKVHRAGERERYRREHRVVVGNSYIEGPDPGPPLPEDVVEPPINYQEFQYYWCQTDNAKPRRYMAPGQTRESVDEAIDGFLNILVALDEKRATRNNLIPGTSTEKTHHTSEPAQSERQLRDLPFKVKSRSYSECTAGDLPTASSSSAPAKPIIVHDYVDYDGPRAKYVPHPPTEMRMAMERMRWVRMENAEECARQGLPYYRGDALVIQAPSFKRRVPKGQSISMGGLKRKREKWEDRVHIAYPSVREVQGRVKRPPVEDNSSDGEDRAVQFRSQEEVRYFTNEPRDDSPPPEAGPSTASSYPHRRRSAQPRRGVLRKSKPVKTIDYHKSQWTAEEDLLLSPKLGPQSVEIPENATFLPFLGAIQRRYDDAALSTAPSTPLAPSAADSAAVMAYLAPERILSDLQAAAGPSTPEKLADGFAPRVISSLPSQEPIASGSSSRSTHSHHRHHDHHRHHSSSNRSRNRSERREQSKPYHIPHRRRHLFMPGGEPSESEEEVFVESLLHRKTAGKHSRAKDESPSLLSWLFGWWR